MSEHSEIMDLLNKIYEVVKPGKPGSTPGTPSTPTTGGNSSDKPWVVLPEIASWTLMLPTGSQGDPDNLYPEKAGIIPGTFYVGSDGGVVYETDVVNGVHSPNSKYARTESRQMKDKSWNKASWSSSGPKSIEVELSIDASKLTRRKRINGIQIHDGSDDVMQVMRHETQGLGVMYNDGKSWLSLDPSYKDGTRFVCKIDVQNGVVKITYNDTKTVQFSKNGTGWYWKVGCYSQTGGASEFTEPAGAKAKVTVYKVITTGGSS